MDDCIRIIGGKPLEGEISIQGSKNGALPMMAASLLARETSVLYGCPRISDVFCMEEILKSLGARTWWAGHDLYLDCTNADGTEIPAAYTGRMRSSLVLLGPVLARNGRCRIGYPGGCVIGKRPIDLHLAALRSLGAEIREEGESLAASAGKLKGNEIRFPASSVGATQQAILAAVLAEGETTLVNCAREPEIGWLCRYLAGMGARIEIKELPFGAAHGEAAAEHGIGSAREWGIGSAAEHGVGPAAERGIGSAAEQGVGSGAVRGNRIRIVGVSALYGGRMQVPPDRIVAGTYLCAAGITRGEIALTNPPEGELDAFLEVYRKIGGQYHKKSGKLIVSGKKVGEPAGYLETDVYPGFPTDLQSPMLALLATLPGKSRIREKIFEDRFRIAGELCRMGARIRIEGRDAFIDGGYPLRGCLVRAKELRGGAALVLAALAAEGETRVEGYSFIRRGYERLCEDFKALGGDIALREQESRI